MVIIVLVLLLMLCAVSLLQKHYAIGLFNAAWTVIFFICRNELLMDIYELTLLLLCLMVAMVNAGYYYSIYRRKKSKQPAIRQKKRKIECDNRLLLWCMVVGGVIFLWYAARTLWIFGFDLTTIRATNNAANDGSAFRGTVDTVLFYGVATPLMYTSALALAYNFSQGEKINWKFCGLLLGVVMLQMISTGGGRSAILRVVLFVAAAVLWRFFAGWKPNRKVVICLVAGAVLLWVLVEVFTYIRNFGKITFVGQAIDYIRGAVGHMQYRLSRLDGPQYYGGYAAFGGFLYYPVKLLSAVTGWDVQTSNELLAYLQEYREIQLYDGIDKYNALVPNAFYFFFDNGYVGVILFSALEGYFIERTEYAFRTPTFLWFVGWATSVYAIVYSALDGVFWSFRHPTTILCCLVLHRYLYHAPGVKYDLPIPQALRKLRFRKGG